MYRAAKKLIYRFRLFETVQIAVLALLIAMTITPAKAEHWEAYAHNVPTQICASGRECAIWQRTTIYGPTNAPYNCYPGYSYYGNLTLYSCESHPNPDNPAYTLSGTGSLICDGAEQRDATGCHLPVGKSPPSECTKQGDPVLSNEGVLYEHVTDYSVGQINPLTFERFYWSDLWSQAGSVAVSRLGHGWHSNFDVAAWFNGTSSSNYSVIIKKSDGEEVDFSSGNNGYYLVGVNQTSGASGNVPGTPHQTLTQNGTTYTYKDDNDTLFVFNGSGQLQTITYRNGYSQTLGWSVNLNTGVTDNLGRSISFTYDSNNDLTTLKTADGQTFSYSYLNVIPPSSGSPAASATVSSDSNLSYALQRRHQSRRELPHGDLSIWRLSFSLGPDG